MFTYQWISGLAPWLVGLLLLDCFFLGAILRLIGLGTWYRGLIAGEEIIYRGTLGCGKAGWNLGAGLVTISNKRFVVRLLWSRLALVDAPLDAVRKVIQKKWWWSHMVTVSYIDGTRHREINLGGTDSDRSKLLQAFRLAAVEVIS